MRLIARLLTFFYRLLYHSFAFAYDAVAAVVSFGQWIDWIRTTLPYVQGACVLEIGHGPGHLQSILNEATGTPQASSSLFVAGLDESAQMGRITRRRLVRAGIGSPRLARSLAQAIPFQADAFDTVVSTFPSIFIFQMDTLAEVHRVLRTEAGSLFYLPPGRKIRFYDGCIALPVRALRTVWTSCRKNGVNSTPPRDLPAGQRSSTCGQASYY